MAENQFGLQMQAYEAWKEKQTGLIREFSDWLSEQKLNTAEAQSQIETSLDRIRQDRLTVAFMGEFSRGKTELINAIFFSEHGKRLLPSEPGRTTMCPSELFYDHEDDKAYIRLLPIETRKEEISIYELKKDQNRWKEFPLDTSNPDEMADHLKEVIRTQQVSVDEAEAMGLYKHENNQAKPDSVEIPVWRHALISFPHPLLKQGLAILDTPGLNALGSEPELTISMLPNAQAILFALGADTGVTKSDMDMWTHHVKNFYEDADKKVIIALNKIDTLWDELKETQDIHATVEKQVSSVAQTLGLPQSAIHPVSAQKALLARIRDNQELLENSGITNLEGYLANEVLPSRQQLLRNDLNEGMGALVDTINKIVHNRMDKFQKQIKDLVSLRGKNMDVIEHLVAKTREEQEAYLRNVESFQTSRKILQQQAKQVLEALSMKDFERVVDEGRKGMEGAWTTIGLRKSMGNVFSDMRYAMDQVAEQTMQTYKLIEAVYRKFHEEHGLPELTPSEFSLHKYNHALDKLAKDADSFRSNPLLSMYSQSFITEKFFTSFVERARIIFTKANYDARNWIKQVLNPLMDQIKEHKQHMEGRLETLAKIRASRQTLEIKIEEMEKQCQLFEQQAKHLDTVHNLLEHGESANDADGASLSSAASG